MHLDPQLQAEFYKIQEEAKSKTSKLRADHDTFQLAQVLLLSQCCVPLLHVPRLYRSNLRKVQAPSDMHARLSELVGVAGG